MTGKASAKLMYEYYGKWAYKQAYYINKEIAKSILRQPIPMSYERWCFLHEYADKELREWLKNDFH